MSNLSPELSIAYTITTYCKVFHNFKKKSKIKVLKIISEMNFSFSMLQIMKPHNEPDTERSFSELISKNREEFRFGSHEIY